jgi:hypothetical protein
VLLWLGFELVTLMVIHQPYYYVVWGHHCSNLKWLEGIYWLQICSGCYYLMYSLVWFDHQICTISNSPRLLCIKKNGKRIVSKDPNQMFFVGIYWSSLIHFCFNIGLVCYLIGLWSLTIVTINCYISRCLWKVWRYQRGNQKP